MNYANRKAQDLLHTPEGVRDCYGKENTARQKTIDKIAGNVGETTFFGQFHFLFRFLKSMAPTHQF